MRNNTLGNKDRLNNAYKNQITFDLDWQIFGEDTHTKVYKQLAGDLNIIMSGTNKGKSFYRENFLKANPEVGYILLDETE
jgi:hypothetical protein